MLPSVTFPLTIIAVGIGNLGLLPLYIEAASPQSQHKCECEVHRTGRSYIATTANFVINGPSEEDARVLAREAERLRDELSTKWLGRASDDWHHRCQIIVYSTHREYVAVVGRGGQATIGSSLVEVTDGAITHRQIDLSGETADYLVAALPHELTHVVLKDRFVTSPLPRWADEGMATLADTSAKQQRHAKDLQDAMQRGSVLSVADLFTLDGYPRSASFGVFYGESLSLTSYLVSRNSPQHFVEFIDQANRIGTDAALRSCYGLNGIAELDHRWHGQLTARDEMLATTRP